MLTFERSEKVHPCGPAADCRLYIYAAAFRKNFASGELTLDDTLESLQTVLGRRQLFAINGKPC